MVEYYFVPLGRERGGYLEFLGLPPDADLAAIAKAEVDYRNTLKNKLKEQRKPLLDQRNAKQITAEEYKAKDEELVAKNSKALAEFGELKQKFDRLQAERRKLAQQGHAEKNSVWVDAYTSFGTDHAEFWQFLVEPRPLPKMAVELLHALYDHWVEPSRRDTIVGSAEYDDVVLDVVADLPYLTVAEITQREKWLRSLLQWALECRGQELRAEVERGTMSKAEAKDALTRYTEHMKQAVADFSRQRELQQASIGPATENLAPSVRLGLEHLSQFRLFSSDVVDLATVRGLANEQEMTRLLSADALWSELRGTNRDFWIIEIGAWAKEVAAMGPRLLLERNGAPGAADGGEFTHLCRPPDRSVDRLETCDLGDIAQEPVRQGRLPDFPDPAMAAFLRAFLEAGREGGKATDANAAEGSSGAEKGKEASTMLDELRAMIELLTRGAENEK
jgi:hypothetical protein